MRKLIFLALAALVAGTVYAETSPSFSGSFDFFATFDTENENAVVGNETGFKIALGGVIDEWTTVNAEVSRSKRRVAERIIEVEDPDGNKKTDGTIAKGDIVITGKERREIKGKDTGWIGKNVADVTNTKSFDNIWGMDTLEILTLNEFTMTNDLTGALGFPDSPVGVSLTWGKTSLVPAGFHGVAKIGYLSHESTDSYYGVNIAVTIIDRVKLITGIYPTTFFSKDYSRDGKNEPVGSIDLQMLDLVEGLNFNLFFTTDPHRDTDDSTTELVPTQELGMTAGYTGLEDWGFGLAFSYDLESNEADVGVSASHNLNDRLITALAFVIDKLPRKVIVEDSATGDVHTTTNEPIELYFIADARFKAIPDTLDVVFSIKIPMKGDTVVEKGGKETTTEVNMGEHIKDNLSFDGGVEAYLGSVTYGLGYEYNQRNTYSPNGDASRGVYFRVKASF